ncbi:MAG: hypothetical protein ACI85I_000883, partial [Arenicella sp.]
NRTFSNEELDKLYSLIRATDAWSKELIQGHDFSSLKQDKVLRKTNPIINNQPLFEFNKVTDISHPNFSNSVFN